MIAKQTKDLFVNFGFNEDALDLVKLHHYSHRHPSAIQFVGTMHEEGGLFGDTGACVAACIFSIPPTRWNEQVLELSRLVRTPHGQVPLTRLIGQCLKKLKRSKWDLVVSFADNTEDHHGGVYQAASWNYHGINQPRMCGLFVDLEYVPGRTCNSRYGTRSPEKLKSILGTRYAIEPCFDKGKHMYWKPTQKRGKLKAERLGLRSLPYPKPSLQEGAA